MKLYDELKWRGLINDITSEDLIDKINNEKVSDSNMIIDETLFKDGYLILSKGKKIHIKVNLK